MSNLFNLIMDGATLPEDRILMMVLFLIIFEGLIGMIMELVKISRK